MPDKEAQQLAMLMHLLSFVGITGAAGAFTGTPIPVLSLLGPLAIWLWKRDSSAFIDRHGKEAVNFNISLIIYSISLSILGWIGAILMVVVIGFLILIPVAVAAVALFIIWIVVVIKAALAARDGKDYQYPLTFRFIK